MADFSIIDYDNCITNVTSSIQKHFGLEPNYKTLDVLDDILAKKDYDNVVIVLFDGMGNNIIDLNAKDNNILKTNRIYKYKSTYPPTTANCTTAYLSGLNPISTGWLGWSTYYKDLGLGVDNFHNLNTLTKEVILGDNIAARKIPYTPMGTIIEKETKGEVAYFTIFPWNLKKKTCVKCFRKKIIDTCNLPGKKYIYAYFESPDNIMHHEGINNRKVKASLEKISKNLKIIEKKTKNSLFIVSADHGHIDVNTIALYTYYDVMDCLYAPFTNDARTPFFFVKDDKMDVFPVLFRKYFSDYYDLYSKQEIMDKHIFGYGKEASLYKDIIGDYVGIAKSNYYFLLSPKSRIFKGHHAGLTFDEMSIPLIIIDN